MWEKKKKTSGRYIRIWFLFLWILIRKLLHILHTRNAFKLHTKHKLFTSRSVDTELGMSMSLSDKIKKYSHYVPIHTMCVYTYSKSKTIFIFIFSHSLFSHRRLALTRNYSKITYLYSHTYIYHCVAWNLSSKRLSGDEMRKNIDWCTTVWPQKWGSNTRDLIHSDCAFQAQKRCVFASSSVLITYSNKFDFFWFSPEVCACGQCE